MDRAELRAAGRLEVHLEFGDHMGGFGAEELGQGVATPGSIFCNQD